MPHKKGHKTRKVKKGGFYGAAGAIAPGAMEWKSQSEMGDWAVSSRGGNTQYGRGRKGKSKKTRKGGKVKRGGSKFGAVSASYVGTGSRGLADVVPIDTKGAPPGSAAGGAFNNFGAQPGSGFGSFVRAA